MGGSLEGAHESGISIASGLDQMADPHQPLRDPN